MRLRVGLVLGVLFVVAGAVAVAVPLVRGAASAGEPDAVATSTGRLFACAEVMVGSGGVSVSDGYCERIADDMSRREPLSDLDERLARPFIQALQDAFTRHLGASCHGVDGLCMIQGGPPAVEAVRRALVGAGFLAPVVRTARFTDPAPLGAIVYAAGAGSACVLGYIEDNVAVRTWTVARLPDKTCLYP